MLRGPCGEQLLCRRRSHPLNRGDAPAALLPRHPYHRRNGPVPLTAGARTNARASGGGGGGGGSDRDKSGGSTTSRHRLATGGGSDMAEDTTQPQPQPQPLSFTNLQGERLAAKLVDASGPDSDDVVILCHGYAATKDGFHFPRLAEELAARGRSSLRFDFAGNGESEGSFSFGHYYREVGDLRAAVEFVRNSLRRKVHAIVGHSKGGNVVLLYASRYDDVPYVVNIAGRGVMSRGIKERFGADILERLQAAGDGGVEQEVRADGGRRTIKYKLTKEAVEERLRLDMLAEAAKIAPALRVLTIHGDGDSVIPVADAHDLADAIGAGRHSLRVVPGADHNFRAPAAAAAVLTHVTEFLTAATGA